MKILDAIFLITFVSALLCVAYVEAVDKLNLKAPKKVAEEATQAEIVSYKLVPGPNDHLEVHLMWLDSNGNHIKNFHIGIKDAAASGILEYEIKNKDLGLKIGDLFKALIWDELKKSHGVDFE